MMILGFSVRDYGYQWIDGGCPIHQWASGGRGIDRDLIDYVKRQIKYFSFETNTPWDRAGLIDLLRYLIDHEGAEPSPYVPDQFGCNRALIAELERLENRYFAALRAKRPVYQLENMEGWLADWMILPNTKPYQQLTVIGRDPKTLQLKEATVVELRTRRLLLRRVA
jgi:hypothetical protein